MADAPSSGGGSGMGGLWVLIIIIILFAMWINNGGPARSKQEGLITKKTTSTSRAISANSNNSSRDDNSDSNVLSASVSKYKGQVRVQRGTAASTYQPNQEYIVLKAQGNRAPISLAGWSLQNGRGEKLSVVSGSTVQTPSVSVKIPSSGIAIFDPYNPQNNVRVPITLKSGEKTIITTGKPAVFSGVTIRDNFKTNRCLGYLEDDRSYRAYPSLSYRCPSSNDVQNISYLDDTCYKFVRSIRACHTPKDIYDEDEGYCLDGNCKLSSYCRDFVKKNYNFATCFATYSRDADFVAPEWRIFLNQPFELWADRRESISVFDPSGLLVDKITY